MKPLHCNGYAILANDQKRQNAQKGLDITGNHIDGSLQDCAFSIGLAMEIPLSCHYFDILDDTSKTKQCLYFMGYAVSWDTSRHGLLARYTKLWVAHAPGKPGTFSSPMRVSDLDMHYGSCVTHVPWCMPGSLTSGFLWSLWRGNVPGIPGACATRNYTYLAWGPCR